LSPWPEEEFRIAIDACANLLFAPTELNAGNLRREGVAGTVMVTGNTAIDALFEQLPLLRRRRRRTDRVRRLLVTCHRRESWGEALHGIAAALRAVAALPRVEMRIVLHPNPRVASDMVRLLAGAPNIDFRDPCSHREMLELMRESDLLLSDSGGMQEEAPTLGVPLLVLRDRTERPEGIASGNSRLVGRDEHRIRTTAQALLADDRALDAMRKPALPYGDGRASQRIADAITNWLSDSSADSPKPLIQQEMARAG
jgi:UDP-N-acetylglucosamine 2-epimerase (non-hydrolysing)